MSSSALSTFAAGAASGTRAPTPVLTRFGFSQVGTLNSYRFNMPGGVQVVYIDQGDWKVVVPNGEVRDLMESDDAYAAAFPYGIREEQHTIRVRNDLADNFAMLTQRVADLSDIIAQLAAQHHAPAPAPAAPAPSISTAPIHVTADRNGSIIKPPAVFKGDEKTNEKNAQEARTFLTRFINWAEHQQNLHRGDLDGIYYCKDGNWIASFLSFMEGTARAWATQFLQKPKGTVFNNDWAKCKKAFKERFAIISTEENAQHALRRLKQGEKTIPAYVLEFCQHADQAGYSQVELHDRFYLGLSPKMQELLITHPGMLDTLDELVKACKGIQKHLDTFHC